MNKKGYYRFADIGMFFLVFLIVGVAIGAGIYAFYFQAFDTRESDVRNLQERLEDFLIKNGKLNKKILEKEFNIYEEAELNRKVIKEFYYFRININSLDSSNFDIFIEEGQTGFDVSCNLKGKRLPKCIKKNIVLENYKINMLVGSNQGRGE